MKQDFIQDPYEERPYNIITTDIEDIAREDLKFKSKYGHPLKDAWNGHGLEGDLEVEGDVARKMRRVISRYVLYEGGLAPTGSPWNFLRVPSFLRPHLILCKGQQRIV